MTLSQVFLPFEEEKFQYAGGVLRQFKEVETFIFDVDGVLTNNQVLVTETGEELRSMNVRDGLALKQAVREGYHVLILTGGKSKGVEARLRNLGIFDIVSGLENKLKAYEEFLDARQLDESRILYMGDDVVDLKPMRRVGFPVCPKDAVPEILQMAHYVSPFEGGKGCVRDVIEKVLKLNGKWNF